MRELIQLVPALRKCGEIACLGGPVATCRFAHPAVDEEFEQVLLDVWSRTFTNIEGRKSDSHGAECFGAFFRAPESTVINILQQQPQGVYFEPRSNVGQGPDPKFKIVWLPGADHQSAVHSTKMFSKALCLMRLKQRYGVRVLSRDEECAFKQLRPGVPFVGIDVKTVFQLHPLPHGTQKGVVGQLLQSWGWKARPLQPGRSRFDSMVWLVGATDPPPQPVLRAFDKDVLVTEVKAAEKPKATPQVIASRKTQEHIRKHVDPQPASTDPWHDPVKDPWSKYFGSSMAQPSQPAGEHDGKKRYESLAKELKEELKKEFQGSQSSQPMDVDNDQRMQTLESGMAELTKQNVVFQNMFGEMGKQCSSLQSSVHELQRHATAQQQDIANLSTGFQSFESRTQGAIATAIGQVQTDMASRFDSLEALLHKKARQE